jgi:hypothetical protein
MVVLPDSSEVAVAEASAVAAVDLALSGSASWQNVRSLRGGK